MKDKHLDAPEDPRLTLLRDHAMRQGKVLRYSHDQGRGMSNEEYHERAMKLLDWYLDNWRKIVEEQISES